MTAEMLATVVAPVSTLLGVACGSFLGTRAERRREQRDVDRRQLELRQLACLRFLEAARRWHRYLLSPSAQVRLVENPTQARPLAVHEDPTHLGYEEEFFGAWTHVEVLVGVHTVEQMDAIRIAIRELAAARAVHGAGEVPREVMEKLRTAEQRFAATAGRLAG
jgi:hypothetical protein